MPFNESDLRPALHVPRPDDDFLDGLPPVRGRNGDWVSQNGNGGNGGGGGKGGSGGVLAIEVSVSLSVGLLGALIGMLALWV